MIADRLLDAIANDPRSERRLQDTVVATEVIRREDIAASGAQNAAEVLATHVGVELAPSLTTAGETIRLQPITAPKDDPAEHYLFSFFATDGKSGTGPSVFSRTGVLPSGAARPPTGL